MICLSDLFFFNFSSFEGFIEFVHTFVDNLRPHLEGSIDDWDDFFEDKEETEMIEWITNHVFTKFDEAIDGAFTELVEELTWLPDVLDKMAIEFEDTWNQCDIDGEVIV